MNYRSHQKIVVVDGNVIYGWNEPADEYVNLVRGLVSGRIMP